MPSYTESPTLLVNAGSGTPWQNPTQATGSGIGSAGAVVIQSVTITANVVTFATTTQFLPLVAGQSVVMSNMINSTFLNGVTLITLSSGLSTTSFSANFTHADLGTTNDAGVATPTTQYAFAQNIDGSITPGPGQFVTFAFCEGAWTGGGIVSSNQLGFPCVYTAFDRGCAGYGGGSLNPSVATTSPFATVPTLPPGATVVGIYAVANSLKVQISGSHIALEVFYSGVGSPSSFLMTGAESTGNLGTNLSILNSAFFQLSIQATLTGIAGYYGGVASAGFAIVYTLSSGSPIPPNQLQTLEGTNCGFSLPSSTVNGIEVLLDTGIISGTTCTLQVQLTVAGTPVGAAKSLSVGSWSTSYTLGNTADLWGTGGLTVSQVNGTNGLGVNISGTLADNSQVNLNGLELVVFAGTITTSHIPVVWVRIGTTKNPNV